MFLSCDWGTTAFRLRLVRVADLRILAETTKGRGIAETYHLWMNQANPQERQSFYASLLEERVAELSQRAGQSLTGMPIVLSGMASSSIGMKELPYQKLPVHLDGTNFRVEWFPRSQGKNPLLVISGIQTDNDVIRGEETKLVGCSSMLADDDVTQLIVVPGTHSKHVTVKRRKAVAFKTYMTGEFFKLLSVNSVLSTSVEKIADADEPRHQMRFREGVRTAKASGLLHGAFLVRTNQLLQHMSKAENFYYLSGVLIGSELKEIPSDTSVYLAAGSVHHTLYKTALEELGVTVKGTMDADSALIAGQLRVLLRNH